MIHDQRVPWTLSLLLYSADTKYPLGEMALGFGRKSRPVEDTTQNIDASPNPEVNYNYDPEKGDEKERKMSRVGGAGVTTDSDSQISVGKQVELEADNAIKYRTCSWKKVIYIFTLLVTRLANTACTQ